MELKDGELRSTGPRSRPTTSWRGERSRLDADENDVESAVLGGKLPAPSGSITSYDVDPATLQRTPSRELRNCLDKEEEAGAR